MFHFKIVSNAFVDDQGVVKSFLIVGWRVRVARREASNVGPKGMGLVQGPQGLHIGWPLEARRNPFRERRRRDSRQPRADE